MTVDLEAQVRAYTDFLDSTLQVVEAGDVISERLDGLRHSEDPARLVVPRWAVAVAAAIGALLVVGGLAVWLRAFIEDPPPVVDEPE
ncbi:MAG: hypothetical protein OEM97_00755, partial [Acidimicrobiia bacterium]|nr:hypothetical protein [Acidimicrobiia bacterium]